MSFRRIDRTSKRFLAAAVLGVCAVSVILFRLWRGGADDPQTFVYAALGDSIPNGYSVSEKEEVKGYPQLLAEDIEREEKLSAELFLYTKDGITVNGLYETYLSDAKVKEELEKADLITVTAGANDLLKRFRDLYQEIFGGNIQAQDMDTVFKTVRKEASADPRLLKKAVKTMNNWDYEDFERDWKMLMESIRQSRKEGADLIATTIYDPMRAKEETGALNQVTAAVIGRMNDIIIRNSKVYGYQTADLSGIGLEAHLQSDGLHPDGQGQQMIMEQIRKNVLHLYSFSCTIFKETARYPGRVTVQIKSCAAGYCRKWDYGRGTEKNYLSWTCTGSRVPLYGQAFGAVHRAYRMG